MIIWISHRLLSVKDVAISYNRILVKAIRAKLLAFAQQAGGFDKLLLDSLYEDEARRQQIASVTYTGSTAANPFDHNDPFAMSNSFAPPSNVQLAMMAEQQQYYHAQQQQYYQIQQQHQMVMLPPQTYQQQSQYSAPSQSGLSNPFGDPFSSLVTMANPPKQSNSNLVWIVFFLCLLLPLIQTIHNIDNFEEQLVQFKNFEYCILTMRCTAVVLTFGNYYDLKC
jgi:hypothetical protein